jgi:hypothetical protein
MTGTMLVSCARTAAKESRRTRRTHIRESIGIDAPPHNPQRTLHSEHRFSQKPNAAAQARQTAGATQERTLFAVACSRLFG